MVKRRSKPVEARHVVPLQEDSPKPSAGVPIWECPNCGQRYFGTHPPDLCAYCRDFTTWKPVQPDEPA